MTLHLSGSTRTPNRPLIFSSHIAETASSEAQTLIALAPYMFGTEISKRALSCLSLGGCDGQFFARRALPSLQASPDVVGMQVQCQDLHDERTDHKVSNVGVVR